MTIHHRELTGDELGAVTGGGLVDTVLSDSEAATNEFLKKFAETSQRFNAFISAGNTSQAPVESQG